MAEPEKKANPFDQFDIATNPFDQFDTTPVSNETEEQIKKRFENLPVTTDPLHFNAATERPQFPFGGAPNTPSQKLGYGIMQDLRNAAIANRVKQTYADSLMATGKVKDLIPAAMESVNAKFAGASPFFSIPERGIRTYAPGTGDLVVNMASAPIKVISGTGKYLSEGAAGLVGASPKNTQIAGEFGANVSPFIFPELAGKAKAMVAEGVLPKSISAPFAKSYDAPTAELANKYGVELPASSLTTSRVVPLIESAAGKGLFGDRIGTIVDNAGKKITQIADNTVESFGKSTVPTDVGNSIAKGLNSFETTFRETKNQLYDNAKIDKGAIKVEPTQALEQLNSIINDLDNIAGEKPPILKYLKSLRGGLLRNRDAINVQATIRDLNTKVNFKNPNPIIQGYEGRIKGIAGALSNDLDSSIKEFRPDLAGSIDKANTYYKEGVNKLNSAWGRKINQFVQQGKVSELPDALLNKSTPVEWIPKMFDAIGEDASQSLRAATFEKIINKAKGSGDILTAQGISNQIKTFGADKLNAMFGAESANKLTEIGKLAEAWGKGQRVASGSQTAFLGRILLEGSGLIVHPIMAIKAILGDAAFSKFIGSPTGQKWLTGGFSKESLPAQAGFDINTGTGRMPPQPQPDNTTPQPPVAPRGGQGLESAETTISPASSSETGLAAPSSAASPENGTNPVEGSKTTLEDKSTNLPFGKTAYEGMGNPPENVGSNVENVSDKSKGFFIPTEGEGVTSGKGGAIEKGANFTLDEAIKSMNEHEPRTKRILEVARTKGVAEAHKLMDNPETSSQHAKEAAEAYLNKLHDRNPKYSMRPEDIKAELADLKRKQSQSDINKQKPISHLRPAIFHNGKFYTGNVGDRHDDIKLG